MRRNHRPSLRRAVGPLTRQPKSSAPFDFKATCLRPGRTDGRAPPGARARLRNPDSPSAFDAADRRSGCSFVLGVRSGASSERNAERGLSSGRQAGSPVAPSVRRGIWGRRRRAGAFLASFLRLIGGGGRLNSATFGDKMAGRAAPRCCQSEFRTMRPSEVSEMIKMRLACLESMRVTPAEYMTLLPVPHKVIQKLRKAETVTLNTIPTL